MAQEHIWDREYKQPQLLTRENKPQSDVMRFVKFLKKQKSANTDEKYAIETKQVLDLGSGTGRNSFYFAELGADVTGLEISQTAIDMGREYPKADNLRIIYIHQSIGETFPVADKSIDIVLDITSSNSLNEKEREVYVREAARVLKPDGYFFVKTLCKDGDDNAKYLLKNSPGPEHDTYVMKELGLVERVWSREDFEKYYSQYFKIIFLEKKTSYSKMNNRSYKRNFWLAYMQPIG
jgi:SAM-dependent methyltransferase